MHGYFYRTLNRTWQPPTSISKSLLPPQLPLWSGNMIQVTNRYSLQRHKAVPRSMLMLSEGFNLLTNNTEKKKRKKKKGWDALLIALRTQWWWLCLFSGNSDTKLPGCKSISIIWVLSSLHSRWLITLWFAFNRTPLQYIRKPTQSLS